MSSSDWAAQADEEEKLNAKVIAKCIAFESTSVYKIKTSIFT